MYTQILCVIYDMYMYIYIYIYIHTCTHGVYIYIYIYTHHVYMYVYIYIHVHMVCIYIYIYMYDAQSLAIGHPVAPPGIPDQRAGPPPFESNIIWDHTNPPHAHKSGLNQFNQFELQ